MRKNRVYSFVLLTTTALSLGVFANQSIAQTKTQAQPEQLLGEVVVTATRQSDTINRVAMSVAAVTQQSIQQQGLNNLQDRVVKAGKIIHLVLFIGSGIPVFHIRVFGR